MNSNDVTSDTADEVLGTSAYIAVDCANCLYKPELQSAIRVTPPYGTEVRVVDDRGPWVLIEFCGKKAWSPRANLSADLAKPRLAVDAGVAPLPNYAFRPAPAYPVEPMLDVEYGPRGGRFVRTGSGFRRYF